MGAMCEPDTALAAAATWVLAWLWASASAWCWQPPQAARADAVLSQGLSVMPSMVHVCISSSAFQAWADFSLFMVLLPRDAPLMVALGVPATSCCSHPRPLGGAGVTVLQVAPASAAAGCKYHSCSLGGCLVKVGAQGVKLSMGKCCTATMRLLPGGGVVLQPMHKQMQVMVAAVGGQSMLVSCTVLRPHHRWLWFAT